MGDRISLRSMFLMVAATAAIFIMLRLAIVHQKQGMFTAAICVVAIPITILLLYGVFYVILLPFGVLTKVSTENLRVTESPFATDRLPDAQLPVSDLPTNPRS